ncbi:MAG: hypothetical protein KC474_10145 [Cyanobacteria bacterium HKST-UBA04]|nr:hypothetical protein [Cyanobacteria bacterium HKST-UBA04]
MTPTTLAALNAQQPFPATAFFGHSAFGNTTAANSLPPGIGQQTPSLNQLSHDCCPSCGCH